MTLQMGISALSFAQNFPFIQYSEAQQIAPGVSWWSGESIAPNPLWQIRVIEVDLANPNVALVPAIKLSSLDLEKTTAISDRFAALAAINAGYFSSGSSVSHFERFNSINAFTVRGPRSAFGLSRSLPPVLAQTPVTGGGASSVNDVDWLSVTEAIGGGPSLLTNGAVDVRDVEENFDAQSGIGPTVRNPRTGLGWNTESKKVWLVTVDGRQPNWSVGMNLNELARLLQDLGANRGLNYDGGGSTVSVVNGQIINQPSDAGGERSVVTAWLVLPAYTVDNLSPDFSTTGSWIPSANSGFYGENSLVKGGGTGTDVATWSVNLAETGTYRVEAWWVAASNRPTEAAFTITTAQGEQSISQNQTANGSRWNSLGEFEVDAGTASVSLSNQAPGGTFISADAVRWIRVQPVVEPEPVPANAWLTQ
ncbi:MAG: phosphodiester glycosidase family protein [Sumerlaeia bacterium]